MVGDNILIEEPVEVNFENRNRARMVYPPMDAEARDIIKTLDIKQPEALILIAGTRGEIADDLKRRLQQLFSRGIARAAVKKDALILDCGIGGGVMELMGQGVADRKRAAPLLGVAPKSQVTYPGGPDPAQSKDIVPLDKNHTHFVLLDEATWEDATERMLELSAAICLGKCNELTTIKPDDGESEKNGQGPAGLGQEDVDASLVVEDSTDENLMDGDLPEVLPVGEDTEDESVSDEVPPNGESPEDLIERESGVESVESEKEDEPGETVVSDEEEPDEEPALEELTELKLALCKVPAVTVLAGGKNEELAKKEVLYSVRQGWPVIILQGSGELPDEIFQHHSDRQTALTKINIEARRTDGRSAKLQRLPYIPDPDLAEIVVDGKLIFIPADANAEELREIIIQTLPAPWDEDVLKQAWERFATYDKNAGRHQNEFKTLTTRILWLGFLTTLMAIILTWVTTSGPDLNNIALQILRWTVIALPILTSIGISIFNRRKSDNKWLLLRGGAESLKRKIYAYRALAPYEPRQQLMELEQEVENVSQRLMRTEVNESALTIYEGPIPPKMYGAAETDDGLSPLDPDRYIEIRIGDQVSFYKSRTNQKEEALRYFQLTILVAGGLGTFLAAIGGELWVPLTTAAVTAITSYLLSEQLQETIVRYNQNKTDLQNVEIWWRALSPTDKEKPENIKKLVNTTEDLMIQEVKGWVQNMQDALSDLRKDLSESDQQNSSK